MKIYHIIFSIVLLITVARGEITLAPVFSDHMVLQRDMAVSVWGTSTPGEKVTVSFDGASASGVAGPDGNWRVQIGPFPANQKPAIMTVSSADPNSKPLKIGDILVGEVWVGSGQSNMQMTGAAFMPGMKTNDPLLNKSPGDLNLQALIANGPYEQVRIITANTSLKADKPPVWAIATPEELAKFSAQLQVFGIELQKKLNVPVGLMCAAVGGTPSGHWISADGFAADALCQQQIAKAKEVYSPEKEQQKLDAALKKYESDIAVWNALPEAEKKLTKPPYKPQLSPKPGELYRGKVGELHDRVLAPFIGYGIRGVLWDQGESGTGIVGVDQYALMGALIRSWRQEWGQGEFPFLCVQKPSGGGCAFDETDKLMSWASDTFAPLPSDTNGGGVMLENYIKMASYPNVFISCTSDLGGGTHPWNKYAYGMRSAQVALGAVYKQDLAISGPVFSKIQLEGDKIRIYFLHVGQGLTFRHGEQLQGFAVSGNDGKFIWAQATIDGDTVLVSNPAIAQPIAVRYAWAWPRPWANLFNKDGMPAIPFKTDPSQPNN